jgi:hypothetical protein
MSKHIRPGTGKDAASRKIRLVVIEWGLIPYWGDDTKVRKLSGSRSRGDARAFSNLSWNTIFKLPRRWRRWQSTEKLCFAIEIRQESARFHLGTTTRCPLRCLPAAQSAQIHAKRLKLCNLGSLEPDNSDTFVSSPQRSNDDQRPSKDRE